MDNHLIRGFSNYTKQERMDSLVQKVGLGKELAQWFGSFESNDPAIQKVIEELSENTITNYHLPYSIAPNFLVNGKTLFFPLVTEESSVVAAMAYAARFWASRGGFHARVEGTEKRGQVHFIWKGNDAKLQALFPEIKECLLSESSLLTSKMNERGGGILSIDLKKMHHVMSDYYQLDATFDTCDAMGANFINSCLEQFAHSLQDFIGKCEKLTGPEQECKIIMAILSNYTPQSLVRVWVECPVKDLLEGKTDEENEAFAETFMQAIQISQEDIFRAVTHNKGIFNGMDALAIATGNDFRAIEACGHAFASRNGRYRGLTHVSCDEGMFRFTIEVPLSVGVVGGVTALHPQARLSMRILDFPSASQLMMYIAVAGLASNFAAVKALISKGIQQGHMKMHLSNILNQLNVPEEKRTLVQQYFAHKPVSFSAVEQYLKEQE